ncbi:hypothetical protein J1N35_013834 [Gossypium stocksii]|uniref:Endonuclease/exonuclease/phosphatase domain-containing protein n=1 Tax=Gossypium stocksii TaxID=47602 RepID=A0A9D3VUF6_9ROSI|nr:hypothetical protein J1N35_013834 [Gossypium stocksii]
MGLSRVGLRQANKLNHGMGFGAAERKVSAEASLEMVNAMGRFDFYYSTRVRTLERLDRAIGNDAWLKVFLNSLFTHLPRLESDHRPLFLFVKLDLRFSKE